MSEQTITIHWTETVFYTRKITGTKEEINQIADDIKGTESSDCLSDLQNTLYEVDYLSELDYYDIKEPDA